MVLDKCDELTSAGSGDCSKDNQMQKPYMICENKEFGRHLVASRDIKAGEVVIKEPPLLIGPRQITGPVCLGCLEGLTATNSEPCPLCGWPLCKKKSCKKSEHHIPECLWATEKKGTNVKISQFVTPHPTYECITPLRLCYMMCDPEKWQPFAKLQSHCEQRKRSYKYESDRRSVAHFLQRFYKLDMTDEQILKACGIIQVNGHEVITTDPPHVALFNDASLLEHSCLPTCCKTFTASGEIVVYATAPISRGTHLSISYTDTLWGTATRRHHLAETKFFACHCLRCEDLTEFGTFFSALACQISGCLGSMLPKTFCDEQLPWVCNKCEASVQAKDVLSLLDKIGQEMSTLSQQSISASKHFLAKWEPFLHKNHFYLTEARLGLAQRYGEDGIQKVSDSDLSDKIKLCRQLLELLDKVVPGEFRLLGIINFQLYLAGNEIARRKSVHTEVDPQDMLKILQESKKWLENCVSYLVHEPDASPEGMLRIQAQRAIQELSLLL